MTRCAVEGMKVIIEQNGANRCKTLEIASVSRSWGIRRERSAWPRPQRQKEIAFFGRVEKPCPPSRRGHTLGSSA